MNLEERTKQVQDILRLEPGQIHFVAEIGINHNGSLDITKQLIDLAKRSGCDSVKFQKRTIDIVYSKNVLDTPRESPWGTTTRQQKEGLEFDENAYSEIDSYAKSINMPWFASAWDIPAQDFIEKFNVPYNKIASALGTHIPFLERVAKEKKLTFLSTGMMNLEQIDKAVDVFKKSECPFVLMHTTSVYPCPESSLNLKALNTLRDRYQVPVGYSGHESTVMPTLVAAVLGAIVIERHITLDRAMYGSDQAASLAEKGLTQLIDEIRRLPAALGDGVKKLEDGELSVAQKLRYWNESV